MSDRFVMVLASVLLFLEMRKKRFVNFKICDVPIKYKYTCSISVMITVVTTDQ